MVKIWLGGLVIAVVMVRVLQWFDISFSDLMIMLFLFWGFIGVIEAIEKLGKSR